MGATEKQRGKPLAYEGEGPAEDRTLPCRWNLARQLNRVEKTK